MEWLLSCMNEDGANSYIPLSKQFGAESAMNRNIVKLISLLAILALFSVWAFGQAESGAIDGTVTDKTGAVVVGAKVTATSIDTGLVRTTTTKSAGEYTITNLPPKMYEVTIEAQGFQKYTQQVRVGVGSMNDVSAKLAVTGASTTVEVTGSAEGATVNTENQTLSQVITSREVVNLPTLTRNPYDLVAISGNVTEDNNSNRGAGYAINGARSSSTDILLDGGENVDLFTATVGQSVPLDTVQEFSVLTNNFTAEYGRAGGGVVNVATKSGTNAFHGSLYEFNRVSALAANTYNNDAQKAQAFLDGTCVVGQPCGIGNFGFTRNQFGYAIGGPIVKNKLFFFSGTEWTRVRGNTTNTVAIVDPAWLALPQVSPLTVAYFDQYGKIRPNFQTVSKATWGQSLGTTDPSVCAPLSCSAPFGLLGQYNSAGDSGAGFPQNTYSTVDRVDYNLSDKTSLYGRYALYSENDFAGTINSSPYAGFDTGQTLFNQNVTINLTHVFTPSFVSSTKLIYNRLNQLQPLNSPSTGGCNNTTGICPTLYTSSVAVPTLVGNYTMLYPGYSEGTPGNAIPFGGPQNLYQIYEDLNWTKGKHQFKFGGSYIQTRDNRVFGAYENAVESLGGDGTIGGSIPNLLSGQIYQFQGAAYPQGKYPCVRNGTTPGRTYVVNSDCLLNLPATEPSFGRNNHYNDGSFYAQDAWKVVPRLTLNLGLRWDYYGVQHNANPNLDSNFYLGPGANLYQQVRTGTVQIADQSPVGGLWAQDKDNFAPRVGFAWDIFGDGSTSLRGGYGIGYERNFGNVTFNVIQNPPNYAVISLTSEAAGGSDIPFMPVYTNNFGPLGGTIGAQCLPRQGDVPPGTSCFPNASLRAVQQNLPTAYSQFWSAAIDRQVMRNSVLSVEYSGSKGTGLYDIANLNDAGYGSAFMGDARVANRVNYQYTNINYRGGAGFSDYNGLNVKFSTSNLFNKGLQLVANYTWSHSIDNLSSTFSDGYSSFYGLGYLDAYDPGLNKGSSDYDTRQRLVISGVWDLPWMKNSSNAFARQALGGWSMSPIIKAHSGYPFSIYDCSNLGSVGYSCPLWIPGGPAPGGGNAGMTLVPGSPNTFNYINLPIDPATGSPIGVGNALAVPTCTGLYGVGCTFSNNGQAVPPRNGFVSPNYWNIDFVAMKNFKLTERFTMQFRGEFYNLFNHHNNYILASNLDIEPGTQANAAGAIQAVRGAPSAGAQNSALPDERRNIQFALKLLF
jgi:outer membrane receptor protein involved in Fe transport